MGHRGLYRIMENGMTTYFYSHWGAGSVFSALYRLQNALDIKEEQYPEKSIANILAHLGYDGSYIEDGSETCNLFMEILSKKEARLSNRDFIERSYLEVRITLNIDTNTALFEFNKQYHKNLGNYYLPINEGLHNIKLTIDYAERNGIEEYSEIVKYFEENSGIGDILESAYKMKSVENDVMTHYIADSLEYEEEPER